MLICNSLVRRFPRLVYSILSTCKKIYTNAVKKQWQLIHELYQIHIESKLGPLIDHGSEGDSERQKLMLESVLRSSCGLNFALFLMKVEISNMHLVIMTQDPPHVGKKLRNALLLIVQNVFWKKKFAHIFCL